MDEDVTRDHFIPEVTVEYALNIIDENGYEAYVDIQARWHVFDFLNFNGIRFIACLN